MKENYSLNDCRSAVELISRFTKLDFEFMEFRLRLGGDIFISGIFLKEKSIIVGYGSTEDSARTSMMTYLVEDGWPEYNSREEFEFKITVRGIPEKFMKFEHARIDPNRTGYRLSEIN